MFLLKTHAHSTFTRGGVEDTRLEAKAKDTKKFRGQGQPFRGQTLSRPRTGMLEAKAKNQGHRRKCSPKQKDLQKSFSGNLQFIGIARIFDWGGLNHKSHAMTSSKTCLLPLNKNFAKGEGLNWYNWKVHIRNFRDEKASVTQTYHRRGVWGQSPQLLGGFLSFFGKNSYFNAIESHFAHV